MRTEFIKATYHEQAKKQAPWACVVSAVDGGYLAFESYTEFNMWKKKIKRNKDKARTRREIIAASTPTQARTA